jgi:hypothetical protein
MKHKAITHLHTQSCAQQNNNLQFWLKAKKHHTSRLIFLKNLQKPLLYIMNKQQSMDMIFILINNPFRLPPSNPTQEI